MESSDNKIQRLLENYFQTFNEIQNIKKDILNYNKQFKNRLDFLKKNQSQIEVEMLNYLEENNLPGIRNGDYIIMADEKPKQIRKKNFKQEKIQTIFKNYQIDANSQLAQDITNVIIKSNSDDKIKYIKCKQFSAS